MRQGVDLGPRSYAWPSIAMTGSWSLHGGGADGRVAGGWSPRAASPRRLRARAAGARAAAGAGRGRVVATAGGARQPGGRGGNKSRRRALVPAMSRPLSRGHPGASRRLGRLRSRRANVGPQQTRRCHVAASCPASRACRNPSAPCCRCRRRGRSCRVLEEGTRRADPAA